MSACDFQTWSRPNNVKAMSALPGGRLTTESDKWLPANKKGTERIRRNTESLQSKERERGRGYIVQCSCINLALDTDTNNSHLRGSHSLNTLYKAEKLLHILAFFLHKKINLKIFWNFYSTKLDIIPNQLVIHSSTTFKLNPISKSLSSSGEYMPRYSRVSRV